MNSFPQALHASGWRSNELQVTTGTTGPPVSASTRSAAIAILHRFLLSVFNLRFIQCLVCHSTSTSSGRVSLLIAVSSTVLARRPTPARPNSKLMGLAILCCFSRVLQRRATAWMASSELFLSACTVGSLAPWIASSLTLCARDRKSASQPVRESVSQPASQSVRESVSQIGTECKAICTRSNATQMIPVQSFSLQSRVRRG